MSGNQDDNQFYAASSNIRDAGKKIYKGGKKPSSSEAKQRTAGKDPKPILISPKDEKVVTDEKLRYIFEDVKDMPVAIYSICGPFRMGKSFLLNLFIKYLEKMEKKKEMGKIDHSWMDAKTSDLGGFSWGGGMDPNTQGILIYSKPFVMKDAQGRKVAVFLMNTQGFFDFETSVTKCCSIFALSTLISSMQIYNLSKQIQEDNLQYLQLFTDYGRAIQESASENRTPFQNLLFLIRDWPHETTGYGWEGGEKLLEKVLAVKDNATEDLKRVRKHIEASFENISCFLMPHPGMKTAQRKDDDQKFESQKMKKMFRIYLDNLARDLFSPQKLAIKQICGRLATGQNMIDHISGLLHNFNPISAPYIGTLFQTAAEQTAAKTLEECVAFCKQKWKELKHPDNYLEEKDIDTKGEKIKEEVLEKFRTHVLLGDQSFRDIFQEKLRTISNQHMLLFKQENERTIKRKSKKYKVEVERAAQEFQDKLYLENKNVELFDHQQLEKHRVKIESEILKKFDKEHAGKLKEKYSVRLKDEIQLRFMKISHNRFLEQTEIWRRMEKLVQECYKKFKDKMSHHPDTHLEEKDIDTKGREIKEEVLEKFRTRALFGDQSFRDIFQDKLDCKINQHMLLFKQENEQTIKRKSEKYKVEVEDAAQEFQDKLQQENKNLELFDHERLEKHRIKVESEILQKFDKQHVGKLKEKYSNRLKDEIQLRFMKIAHKSFLEQTEIRRKMEKLVQECYRKFEDEMSQEMQESDRSKFSEMLETARKLTYDLFDEKSKNYEQVFRNGYRNELERRIKEYNDFNNARFDAKKEQGRIKFQEDMKEAENKYKVQKSELKTYLNEEELAAFHKKCRKTAEEYLQTCHGWKTKELNEEKRVFQSQLCEFFDDHWKLLQYKNEELKNEIVLGLKQTVLEITKRYSYEMAQVLEGGIKQNEQEEKHRDALDRAVKDFDKSVEKIQHLNTQKDEYRQELQDEIKKQYSHNLLQVTLQEMIAKEKVSNLLDKCSLAYTEYMSKKLQKAVTDEQFDELHEFASERAQHLFDESVSQTDEKETQREGLSNLIEKNKRELLVANKNKQSTGKALAAEHAQKAMQFYQSQMRQVSTNRIFNTHQHMVEHNTAKEAALDDFKDKASKLQMYQYKDFKGNLTQKIESEWIKICSEHKNYKKQAENRIKERATELLNSCGKQLKEKVLKHVNDDELSAYCENLKNKTLQTFDENKTENLLECFQKERDCLEQNLETYFSHYVGLNTQNMKELEQKLQDTASFAKASFKEALQDISDQCVDDEELEKRIQKKKHSALTIFEMVVRGIAENLVEPVRNNLQQNMEKIASKIKDEVPKNKKHIEAQVEFASREAITYMKFEKMKILNDKINEDKARYRALEAAAEAMEVFETHIERCGKKFDARKYQQETKLALLKLKKEVIESVRNQKM